jgi:hypothetical protein
MVTENQILANRQNGKLGGVKTEAGKRVSRMNAVTHGLLTKVVLLKDEDGGKLKALREGLVAQYQPLGEIEFFLVEKIASCIWKLRREEQLESTHKIDAYTDMECNGWTNLTRYRTTIERELYRALHELERQQGLRRGQNVPIPLALDVTLDQPITANPGI